MLLAIDVGNTNIHFGVYQDESLVDHWRLGTDRDRTGDELGLMIGGLLANASISFDQFHGVAISSVVPPLTPAVRYFVRRYVHLEPAIVGENLRPRITVRYSPPEAVGADRLVDAVAVLRRFGAPAVVVDFGTATTFNAISRDGEYLGGAIAPGVGTSMEALFRTAAHLPRIEIARPPSIIGDSTVHSMQAGAYYGFLSQLEGMVRRFRQELGQDTRVIATGGLAQLIAPDTDCIDHAEPHLTLDGLRIVWEESQAPERQNNPPGAASA
jgi:type III pantothenate kinase